MEGKARYAGALLLVLVALTGCGGGSDDSFNPYVPPAEVIAPQELQVMAAREMLVLPTRALGVGEGDLQVFGFGRLPAIRNLVFMVLFEYLDEILAIAPLDSFLPLQSDQRLLALLQSAAKAGPAGKQVIPETFFDWTDPETGLHWTGTVVESGGQLVPTLHGVGSGTDCTVTLRLVFELGSRLTLSGTATGPIKATLDVYENGAFVEKPGRAILNGRFDLQAAMIPGQPVTLTSQTTLAADFQRWEDSQWRIYSREDARTNLAGTLADQGSLTLNGTATEGFRLGAGLYWARHDYRGELAGVLGEESELTYGFTDEVVFSDRKTGQVTITQTDEGPRFGGYLRAADGTTLGTLTGDPLPLITWSDGSTTPLFDL